VARESAVKGGMSCCLVLEVAAGTCVNEVGDDTDTDIECSGWIFMFELACEACTETWAMACWCVIPNDTYMYQKWGCQKNKEWMHAFVNVMQTSNFHHHVHLDI